MIHLTNFIVTEPCKDTKAPIRQAIEDAAVVGGFSFVSAAVALGWPPSGSLLYVPALSAVLVGIVSYAKARAIDLGAK